MAVSVRFKCYDLDIWMFSHFMLGSKTQESAFSQTWLFFFTITYDVKIIFYYFT